MLRIKGHTFIRIKGFLYYSSPTKDSFTIRVRQQIPLLFQSDKGFLYYSGPTKDSVLFLSHRIPLLLLSRDSFTIRVRQGILYYSSLKGFLYYSGPTKQIPLLFQSDKGFLYYSCPTKGPIPKESPS